MFQEQLRQAVAVERAGLAEDRLGARVVPRGNEPDLIAHEPPAGQGAGGLLDVVLGVMADAEREQLHQLAGQVLVGVVLGVVGRIEPDEQGRVAEHRAQELSERGAAERAEDLVLPAHQPRSLTLRLLVAKWLCHISVSRSASGSGPKSMR